MVNNLLCNESDKRAPVFFKEKFRHKTMAALSSR